MKNKFNLETDPFSSVTSSIRVEKVYGNKFANEMLKTFSEPPFYGKTNSKICSEPEDQNQTKSKEE